jgi:tRNA dimethylallyltransferase
MVSKSKTQDAPIFLVGATGTGKRPGGAAILCMDAMQVYRGADIGTSKPTLAERAEVPHGGLDLVDLDQSFDVAQYLKHAEAFLREQREAGRRVLIVGGTGLYFRALTRGLCEAPQGSDELRAELAVLSVDQLQERLKRIDPAMLGRIDTANPRRLVRAIEVFESTGKSLATWQEETPEPLVKDFEAIWVQRERAELEQRIAARVEAMFAQGWVQEVRGLMERYGTEAVRKFAGIGYEEITEWLKEQVATEVRGQVRSQMEFGNEALKSNILMATRQYAKRQLTWFAREPNLQQVMLTGNESFSAALRAADAAHGSPPDLL